MNHTGGSCCVALHKFSQPKSFFLLQLESEIVSKVGSKAGTKNSVLAILKCMDGSVLAFL